MAVVPDFGYDADNTLLESAGAPRNWELMTGILSGNHRHEGLRTHIALRKLKQEREAFEKKAAYKKKLALEATVSPLKQTDESRRVLKPEIHENLMSLQREVTLQREGFT